jgi:hypothetical protein
MTNINIYISLIQGIYMKSRWNDDSPNSNKASITNILYENIVIDRPQQYAIWIGPAQQQGQPCDIGMCLYSYLICI